MLVMQQRVIQNVRSLSTATMKYFFSDFEDWEVVCLPGGSVINDGGGTEENGIICCVAV
jgi:hypothetical protein